MFLRTLLLLLTAQLAFGQTEARFHRGDDLRWADPAFDDSGWELVASRRPRRLEEFKTNRLWIRTRLVIPAGEPAGMVVRNCACAFYLNGKRVGATGDLNLPRPDPGRMVQVIWLPRDTPPGPSLLAVRIYLPPGNELVNSSWRRELWRVVPQSQLIEAYRDFRFNLFGIVSGILVLILVAVVAALAGLRVELLSVLICAYLAAGALDTSFYVDRGSTNYFWNAWMGALAVTPQWALLQTVAALLAGVRLRARWLAPYIGLVVLVRGAWLLNYWRAEAGWWTQAIAVGYLGLPVLGLVMSIVFLRLGWNKPNAPRLLSGLIVLIQFFYVGARFGSGLGSIAVGIPVFGQLVLWDHISKLLFGVLAGGFVIGRSRERRAEEERMKGELQAARSVQSLLLGQLLPSGVEAVYVPASEVGGDFYYAAPTPEGTLVLVGDVSGKGLQAAMTVSAILGSMRKIKASAPGQVLAELNETLVGNAGFVTCCCVLVRQDEVLMANAGHPAPYFDGVECAAESGLPLGVSAEASWEVSRHDRPSVITLISDGVVEATNEAGELFGFDRALAISGKPAKEIAQAAQAWGQEDDITVVTVR